jgi:hypothetical protein
MNFFIRTIFLLIICAVSISAQPKNLPRFEDYQTPLYKGKIHLPKWITHVSSDQWRDDLGKLSEPPEINFAGKYFVTIHSCGTGCGYYTMTDLSTGRELDLVNIFSFAEPAPKTRDGFEYTTELIYRPNSKMLIVQYNVELKQGKYECRERIFSFKAGKLKPISNTGRECQKFEESN